MLRVMLSLMALMIISIIAQLPNEAQAEGPSRHQARSPRWHVTQPQAERLLCAFARLSVYALYCDWGNQRGLSTALYRFRQRSRGLDVAAERAFPGSAGYNMHEDLRNDISYEWTQIDRTAVCSRDEAMFHRVVNAPFERAVDEIWTIGACR